MRFSLRYGDGFLPMDIRKRFVQEITPKSVVNYVNVENAVRKALESPISSSPISEQVSSNSTCAIIVENPITCPNSPRMLDSVLSNLRSLAVQPDNISIIVTLNNGQNIEIQILDKMLGNLVEQDYSFHIHNQMASKNLDNLGNTPTYNTPILLNQNYVRADFGIGIGEIRPNPFLGATGGRMAILPGISGLSTVRQNTELIVQGNIGPFVLTSPVNIDMMETSNIANLQFILNAIPDWHGSVADFVSGYPNESWRFGVMTAHNLATRKIERRTDIVFVSAGGAPYDTRLFDAIDSLYSASMVTRRDGVIVLIAECDKGLGPDGFRNLVLNSESEDDVLERVKFGFEIGMEKAWYFRRIMQTKKVIICSRLRESLVNERLLCDAVKDPQEGLELAKQDVGSDAEIAIIPTGHAVVPVFN